MLTKTKQLTWSCCRSAVHDCWRHQGSASASASSLTWFHSGFLNTHKNWNLEVVDLATEQVTEAAVSPVFKIDQNWTTKIETTKLDKLHRPKFALAAKVPTQKYQLTCMAQQKSSSAGIAWFCRFAAKVTRHKKWCHVNSPICGWPISSFWWLRLCKGTHDPGLPSWLVQGQEPRIA